MKKATILLALAALVLGSGVGMASSTKTVPTCSMVAQARGEVYQSIVFRSRPFCTKVFSRTQAAIRWRPRMSGRAWMWKRGVVLPKPGDAVEHPGSERVAWCRVKPLVSPSATGIGYADKFRSEHYPGPRDNCYDRRPGWKVTILTKVTP